MANREIHWKWCIRKILRLMIICIEQMNAAEKLWSNKIIPTNKRMKWKQTKYTLKLRQTSKPNCYAPTQISLSLGLEMLQPINHREKWLMTVEICFVCIDQTNGSPPNEINVFTVISIPPVGSMAQSWAVNRKKDMTHRSVCALCVRWW